MTGSRGLYLAIDLAVSTPDRMITGRVLTEGAEQRFSGWLQLLTILQADVDRCAAAAATTSSARGSSGIR